MTRTEDRLVTFLKNAAAEIGADEMRPLATPELSRPDRAGRRHRTAARHMRQRRTRLAILAVTASVAGSAGAVVALNNQTPSPGPVRAAAYIGGSEPNVPAFFVDAGNPDSDRTLRVVSLATGKVTATEPMPADTPDITFLTEQAHTGNYIAAFYVHHSETQELYRFRITGTGMITPLTRINGIILHPGTTTQTVLALSPDGSRLAIAQTPADHLDGSVVVSKIIVLNLKTGARQVWKDSLADGAYQPYITSAVWTPDGQALVFASQMCKVAQGIGPCYWQFRSLRTPPTGGGLRVGPVLLRQNGMNGETRVPAISPDGSSVVEIRYPASPGRAVSLVRISLATGTRVVLHTWPAPGRYQAAANVGNFLIVAQLMHHGNSYALAGWITDSGFHAVHYPPTP